MTEAVSLLVSLDGVMMLNAEDGGRKGNGR